MDPFIRRMVGWPAVVVEGEATVYAAVATACLTAFDAAFGEEPDGGPEEQAELAWGR